VPAPKSYNLGNFDASLVPLKGKSKRLAKKTPYLFLSGNDYSISNVIYFLSGTNYFLGRITHLPLENK